MKVSFAQSWLSWSMVLLLLKKECLTDQETCYKGKLPELFQIDMQMSTCINSSIGGTTLMEEEKSLTILKRQKEAFDKFVTATLKELWQYKMNTDDQCGLDIRDNMTGSHPIYRCWRDYELIFHTSAKIPYKEQQIDRKRHLGNDIVMIVFKE
ncbi:hypothetical protein DFA_05718 [Cavenderia fasciculata]|uniref:Rap-GAP domain-containing protein n=1 Tax=Cavenderia fasciculata TaxID=261658 RepID=F4PM85_CACFS|nr:uncharacterized protein DFA_05718 [Cavenderia fasciculata]EGG23585.1 hypothetical protein DFA_05718 [Cavenderia fasciculata]|eukprot:XP_004361436.1 hypothetical protein DFA_05718 [Cavenderia fasciculata]